jgi:hypothetical protein
MINYLAAKLFGVRVLESRVPGHRGKCYPTWLNDNIFCRRMEGSGVTGFFKLLDGGKEFHGIVWDGGVVWSTEGVYTLFRGPDHTISRLYHKPCRGLGCPDCNNEGETRMTVRERSHFENTRCADERI